MTRSGTDHRGLPRFKESLRRSQLAKIHLTGDGSFKEDEKVGTWATIFKFIDSQGRSRLEIARGRVESGATSTRMEIKALQEGVERLPPPLPSEALAKIQTDLVIASDAVKKALLFGKPDWEEKIKRRKDFVDLKTRKRRPQAQGGQPQGRSHSGQKKQQAC